MMEPNELRAALEAVLFVSSDPVKADDLAESLDESKEAVAEQLERIKRDLDDRVGGFQLEQTAGGWRLATRAEHDPVLRKYFAKKGENRMSIAALETLAIVAYRQPITAPEVSEIRGVNSTAVIRTLLERRMIRVSGRKNVVGSPFLYRTTKEFLVHFGLNDIRDLPRLEEFGDLIGETINDDLVQAIQHAEPTPESAELPLTEEEAAREGTDLEEPVAQTLSSAEGGESSLDDVAQTGASALHDEAEESQLESAGDQRHDE